MRALDTCLDWPEAWQSAGTLSSAVVTAVLLTGSDLVVGTSDGVARFVAGSWVFDEGTLPGVHLLRETAENSLVAATAQGVHRRRADGRWDWVLAHPDVTDVLVVPGSQSGAVLAATAHDGVVRSDGDLRDWESSSAGLTDLRVSGLCTLSGPAGTIVLAGTASGLYASRDGAGSWQRLGGAPSGPVLSCVSGSDGRAWVLLETAGLVCTRDGEHWTQVPLLDLVSADAEFVRALPGRLAIGFRGSALWLVDLNDPSRPQVLPAVTPAPCLDIAADADGQIFVGTPVGVRRLAADSWIDVGPRLSRGSTALLAASPRSATIAVCDLGTSLQVGRVDGQPLAPVPSPDLFPVDLAVTHDDRVWLAGHEQLFVLSQDAWAPVPGAVTPRRLFPTDHGMVVASADGGLRVVHESGRPDSLDLPHLPVPVHRLVGLDDWWVAACAVRDGTAFRISVWVARRSFGQWRQVLAATSALPAPIVADGSGGVLLGVNGCVLRFPGPAAKRPERPADPIASLTSATIVDLAGYGASVVALTIDGLHHSADGGCTWSRLPGGAQPRAVVHAHGVVVALGGDARLWQTSLDPASTPYLLDAPARHPDEDS